MNGLDQKINDVFAGLVVRKDLVKIVKGNAIVPSYVLEYLLGQYCATNDEASIQTGIESVKEILRKHYVHRNEANLVKSTIRERGRHKIIDKVSVVLNEKHDVYEASFSNLDQKKILIDSDTVRRHPKLLVGGVWCIADLEYEHFDDGQTTPYILTGLKPIQLSHFDFDSYINKRRQFSTDEWIDLLIQSIGFDPEQFGKRSKLMQLVRLIPYCERNYNLIELGPKGTGKSHIYSEFSPHGILISGGEVSVPKLFVNNANGRIGLVGYWDTVAFDEFAGKKKRVDKALVDIMKNYMANKSFSRGVETLGAQASMVFIGNTQHNLPYMLKHTDLFDELPEQYYDSAFLDRLHFYIPGWEVDIIRGEMFSDGYGFVVDYLAEILRNMRDRDYSRLYENNIEISSDISTRDRDGIHKTFSGLMKILFPHQEATPEEIEWVLRFAMEGRKRVKDQLMRIDSTYPDVNFTYTVRETKTEKKMRTLEEEQYPQYFPNSDLNRPQTDMELPQIAVNTQTVVEKVETLQEKHQTIQENQTGVTYENLFGDYLKGAQKITLTDAYIRKFFQIRNLMEFIEMVVQIKPLEDEVAIHLVTSQDEYRVEEQEDQFVKIQKTCAPAGVRFTWKFEHASSIHARHIITDHGWKILMDRGLDIYQPYDMNDAFAISNRLQQFRSCRTFEVTYLKVEEDG
ncbi:MAG: TIGR02688 family protein [Anaerolineaceae bacterium]|nr:TIGR02688 family protein [Anaerolineaceae bacterium]